MSYCKHCNQEVEGNAAFGWPCFIGFALIIAAVWSGIAAILYMILYIIYWVFMQGKTCPVCKMGL